ncbi:MAG TPA: NUDIX domain-containing protein [Candidatus Omnitrophica bacterium]|nr:MAG: NUDIX hydrolase [Candidatus Omnitrophota bacterium]RKY39294.1 MAG: NUDIX hydrolase [Candidatus Omnitrophota bacterium]HEC69583.1 NUDIX domain-containing protein [Candidatus Omnitrophota bacterium]
MSADFKFCPQCGCFLKWRKIEEARRKVCLKCGWIYYRNPLPVVVAVAVDKEGRVLLTKRNIEPGKNKWALAGGFIEGGETPRGACLRELKEETGLRGRIIKLIGVYTQNTKRYGDTLIVAYVVKVSENRVLINKEELKEAEFFRRENLPYIPFSSHQAILKDIKDLGIF